jgi:hypothetical protein
MNTEMLLESVKIIIFSSVLFVWVIRYQNIVSEFKQFKYPDWLRDLVGILKISFVIMLMSSSSELVRNGALGIMFLMFMALLTHLKNKSKFQRMIPSLTLLTLSLTVLLF